MEPIITIDVEWAPDWMIERVAGVLIQRRVRSTWFVTHHSDAIQALRDYPHLFELGIHPNLLAGSTHGATEDGVLAHMREIVPDAVSMRTHSLYQTSRFLIKANREYGIRYDLSLFLPKATHLVPHRLTMYHADLIRIPFFWEDDVEMFDANPAWELSDPRLQGEGYRVFNFHPILILLNQDRFDTFRELKENRSCREWDESYVKVFRGGGKGPGSLFDELTESLSDRGRQIKEVTIE